MTITARLDANKYIHTSVDDFKAAMQYSGGIETNVLIEMYEQLKDMKGHKTRLNLVVRELIKRGQEVK